jgi:FkbM family methyltransferase
MNARMTGQAQRSEGSGLTKDGDPSTDRLGSFTRPLRRFLGLGLTLLIYYRPRRRSRSLGRLYGTFIRRGDLCFDIGANVGSRTRAWLNLGARVVAIEPHPGCMTWLRTLYGRNPRVVLLEKALGGRASVQDLWISLLTPSVSSLSTEWINAVRKTPGFSWVRWEERISVEVTTLDALIEQHGEPSFCKIDVEGSERSVLEGLTIPLAALSFEYLPAAAETALECIQRLTQLSRYEFNWSVGETAHLVVEEWLGSKAMADRLRSMPPEAGSGDVYARRR